MAASAAPHLADRPFSEFKIMQVRADRVAMAASMASERVTWQPYDGPRKPESHVPSTAFAFLRERKEPLFDAAHVRNALARFEQVSGVDDDERAVAFENIKAAATHFDVRVSETHWQDLMHGST